MLSSLGILQQTQEEMESCWQIIKYQSKQSLQQILSRFLLALQLSQLRYAQFQCSPLVLLLIVLFLETQSMHELLLLMILDQESLLLKAMDLLLFKLSQSSHTQLIEITHWQAQHRSAFTGHRSYLVLDLMEDLLSLITMFSLIMVLLEFLGLM